MTIRKRIFISNSIMVLMSLLILLGVTGVGLALFKDPFMDVLEQNSKLADNTYEVQSILNSAQIDDINWDILSDNLSKYDYDLYVSDENQKKQYSNISHSAKECIEELEKDHNISERIQLYSMENITIIRCSITDQTKTYSVYATHGESKHSFWNIDRGMYEMFIIVFIVLGVIAIAGLLLFCQFITRLMIKRIMKPVDELSQAAIRVSNGQLDTPIIYDYDDEFKEVCSTFNQMQIHLKDEMEKAQKYEKARTEMVTGISHDLRTPLTSVKGFIKGMLDGIANTPEKQKQYLEISYNKACDMEVLLQKLFFFSKLETGNMPMFLQSKDICRWLEKYVDEKKAENVGKRYEIILHPCEEEYLTEIDSDQMKRVFDNLLENSTKYSTKEFVNIDIYVKREESNIIITFHDDGNGIENDKLPYVFEQFYRGDESRNSKTDGSGLGLYVSKFIIEQQKGSIRAYNDNGFVIEISLPIVVVD